MKMISLTQGQVALVDDCDYEYLSQFKWHATKKYGGLFYANRNVRVGTRQVNVAMHRDIMRPIGSHLVVDHLDCNGLNNCRVNLRVITRGQNSGRQLPQRNKTSKYKGVCFQKRSKKWMAQVSHAKYNIYLGVFEGEADAAKAYDDVALKLHGEHAILNRHHFEELAV